VSHFVKIRTEPEYRVSHNDKHIISNGRVEYDATNLVAKAAQLKDPVTFEDSVELDNELIEVTQVHADLLLSQNKTSFGYVQLSKDFDDQVEIKVGLNTTTLAEEYNLTHELNHTCALYLTQYGDFRSYLGLNELQNLEIPESVGAVA